jgi:hypothetical protein
MNKNGISSRIAGFINRIDVRFLIFITIFLNTVSLKLDENEEQYFAFAKAFMNPRWVPGAVSLKDVPGARIILDLIIGFALRFMSFEQVAVLGRTLIAVLIAFPLARIFKKLRFTNLDGIFLLQIICVLTHQSFFAKEWIFGAFETKGIAYLFIFFSLYCLLDNRYFKSVLFAGIAVYFHFLVGGWFAFILFVYLLASRTPLKTLLGYCITFAVLTAPFGIYLATTYLANNPSIIEGVQISRIYVFIRNPHHLDMIRQLKDWGSSAQVGVTMSLLCSLFCLRLYHASRDTAIRKLTLLNLVLFGQQFLSLLIATFDKSGGFLKFYPFRTSSLSFFLMLVLVMVLIKHSNIHQYPTPVERLPGKTPSRKGQTALITFMLIFVAAALCFKSYRNFNESYQLISPSPKAAAKFSLYDWIKQNTPNNAVFLDLNQQIREDLDFIRKTERDSFSVFKFIPTSNRLIYDWYQRAQEKEKVVNDIGYFSKLRQKYRIDYIVSKKGLPDKTFQLVYHNDYYFLYATQGVL